MNIVKTICLFITIALAPVSAWSAQSDHEVVRTLAQGRSIASKAAQIKAEGLGFDVNSEPLNPEPPNVYKVKLM